MNAVNSTEESKIINWLGLNPALEKDAPGLIDFLDKSQNLCNLVGFYHTAKPDGSLRDLIEYDAEHHPLIKVNGVMRTWDQVQAQFESRRINPNSQKYLKTKIHNKKDNCVWVYMNSDKGFVPDPNETGNVEPIHRLSEEDRKSLLKHALKFNTAHPELNDDTQEKTCVFQVTTIVNDNSTSFFRNLFDTTDARHVGMSLVDEDGSVYSFGGQADLRLLYDSAFHVCGTVNSNIPTPDWEIFREHEKGKIRRVTSMAISSSKARELLEDLKKYNKDGVRFNFLQQNCSSVAVAFIYKATGCHVNQCITMGQYVYRLLPDLVQIPLLGWPLDKIYKVTTAVFECFAWITPYPITWLLGKVTTSVFFIPMKVITMIENIMVMSCGGLHSIEDPKNSKAEEDLSSEPQLHHFSRLFRSIFDIFNDEVCRVHLPARVLDWQKEQPSTVEYCTDKPQLCIVPLA